MSEVLINKEKKKEQEKNKKLYSFKKYKKDLAKWYSKKTTKSGSTKIKKYVLLAGILSIPLGVYLVGVGSMSPAFFPFVGFVVKNAINVALLPFGITTIKALTLKTIDALKSIKNIFKKYNKNKKEKITNKINLNDEKKKQINIDEKAYEAAKKKHQEQLKTIVENVNKKMQEKEEIKPVEEETKEEKQKLEERPKKETYFYAPVKTLEENYKIKMNNIVSNLDKNTINKKEELEKLKLLATRLQILSNCKEQVKVRVRVK